MLEVNDLDRFKELYKKALEEPDHHNDKPIVEILKTKKDGLVAQEISQLSRSIQIALFAKELSEGVFFVADIISRSLNPTGRYYDLNMSDRWVLAIRVAIKTMTSYDFPKPVFTQREQEVGEACLRLKKAGYNIAFNAFGPWSDDQTRYNVSRTIKNLMGLIGGSNVIMHLCDYMQKSGRYHDEMWLFGQFDLGLDQDAKPELPFGWLFSLAMSQLEKKSKARNPQVAWNTIKQLSTDLAASLNCQRYSQFDGIHLDTAELIDCLKDSLIWRELFSVPQVHKITISYFKKVISQKDIWPKGTRKVSKKISLLFIEFEDLLDFSFGNQPCKLVSQSTKERFPTLWEVGKKKVKNINNQYFDPLINEHVNHTSTLFFEIDHLHSLILPRSMMIEAFLTIIFAQIRKGLDTESAKKLTGDLFEMVIEEACKNKLGKIKHDLKYELLHERKGERERQIDVIHEHNNEIHIFEVKAKMLTKKARNFKFHSYLEDINDSFLSLLYQTVRHDYNISTGQVYSTNANEDLRELKVQKICVSPLSYGPITDKYLINQIIRAFNGTNIIFKGKNKKVTEKIENQLNKIFREIFKFENIKNENDLFEYLLDVWWLDLGQLLYVLNRANTVKDAFCSFRNITTTSHDFWTEIAHADRNYLLKGKWKAVNND